MSFRSVWVNKGTDVQSWDGLKQLGVTHVYYDLHEHSRREFDNARSKGFAVGGYTNPQWFGYEPDKSTVDEKAKAYRSRVSQRLAALSLHDEQCDVQFNIEKGQLIEGGLGSMADHNLYVRRLFYWWRRSNAQRITSWTMEGGQGGWFYGAMRSGELASVTFAPQAYDGAMSRWDSYGMVRDLIEWGVPYGQVLPFYDTPELRTAYNGPGYYYFEHRLYP
jgi:hypothetical protein